MTSKNGQKKREYRLSVGLKERGKQADKEEPIYGIVFNQVDKRHQQKFATACMNRVTVYESLPKGQVAVIQMYADEDEEESFYTVCWAVGDGGAPLVAAGGLRGVIRIIDTSCDSLSKNLIGHGGAINDLRVQPLHPHLLLSASKDESIRLWNIQTGICVLIFAGENGHRHEVLSCDFHSGDPTYLVSCGMDFTVRVWSFKEHWGLVEQSDTWSSKASEFPVKYVQYPTFVAKKLHFNYVDCVRFVGDIVLSKAPCESDCAEVCGWLPGLGATEDKDEDSLDILQRFKVPQASSWFMKFSLDFRCSILACGNTQGQVALYDMTSMQTHVVARLVHPNPKQRALVRQTACSCDGRTIIYAGEDGHIWRWDEIT